MKILIDMNLAPRWAAVLSERGIEAAHWKDRGAGNAPDTEIMAYAEQNGYTVLTRDLDFSDLLVAASRSRPSVVQIRIENVCPEDLINRIAGILTRHAAEIAEGALVTITPHKTRLHILPFKLDRRP